MIKMLYCSDVTWATKGLKSMTTRSFVQQLLQLLTTNKHQCAALLPLSEGVHQWPVDSPHKWPVMWKDFPCHDVIMHWQNPRQRLTLLSHVVLRPTWRKRFYFFMFRVVLLSYADLKVETNDLWLKCRILTFNDNIRRTHFVSFQLPIVTANEENTMKVISCRIRSRCIHNNRSSPTIFFLALLPLPLLQILHVLPWLLLPISVHCRFNYYRQVSNIRRTKSQHLKDSRTVLRLSLPNPLKPDVKSRMKMQLEQRRQAMLQLHLSDRQFYCLLGCVLY